MGKLDEIRKKLKAGSGKSYPNSMHNQPDAVDVAPRKTREEKLRDMHPGLKEMWDEYQTMLQLVDCSLPPEETDEDRAKDILNAIRARKAAQQI